jgi:hypothetical protein
MRGWGLVVALFAAAVVVGLLLKELPPGIIFLLAVASSGYGAYRYSHRKKADRESVESLALGFDQASADSSGLLSLPLQLVARGGDTGTVRDVMRGTWAGLEVTVFEFGYRSEDQEHPDRQWSCALAELGVECEPIVIEPTMFFTPPRERGSLPQLELGLGALDETLAIRTNQPTYARSLLGEEMQTFLRELDGDVAFEVSNRMVLAYVPVGVGNSLDLVEAVAQFARLVPRDPGLRENLPSKSARGHWSPSVGPPDSTA